MTARAAFRQDDLTRAVKGLAAAGLHVRRVRVANGGFELIIGDGESAEGAPAPNAWDEELNGQAA